MSSILWLAGAPGAGKSVTAWEVFRRTAGLGLVDIDQLGMLFPDRPHDEEAHLLKQQALAAIAPNFLARGAAQLLVSGVVDPVLADDPSAPLAPWLVDYCLLLAPMDDLRRRLIDRGWDQDDAREAVATQDALLASGFAHTVVRADGPVEVVADQVESLLRPRQDRPQAAPRALVQAPDMETGHHSIFVTGPRAVGCSTVGFALASDAWAAEVMTGFADLDQLSFLHRAALDVSDVKLGIANLRALQHVFAANGSLRFVANGHVVDESGIQALRTALGPTRIVCLRASREALIDHILSRSGGSEARLTGDELADATPAHRASVLEQALHQRTVADQNSLFDHVVDVTERSVEDVVAEILSLTD